MESLGDRPALAAERRQAAPCLYDLTSLRLDLRVRAMRRNSNDDCVTYVTNQRRISPIRTGCTRFETPARRIPVPHDRMTGKMTGEIVMEHVTLVARSLCEEIATTRLRRESRTPGPNCGVEGGSTALKSCRPICAAARSARLESGERDRSPPPVCSSADRRVAGTDGAVMARHIESTCTFAKKAMAAILQHKEHVGAALATQASRSRGGC